MQFTLGFLAGFLANWLFAMLTRLLPATWVRYTVNLVSVREDSYVWLVDVSITPPRWKRALMEPMTEYLLANVSLSGKTAKPAQWVHGDIRSRLLRADGAMTVPIEVLTTGGVAGVLGVGEPDNTPLISDGTYNIDVTIIRSVDGTKAASGVIELVKLGKITAALRGGGKKSHA